jgi:hypothetical protein
LDPEYKTLNEEVLSLEQRTPEVCQRPSATRGPQQVVGEGQEPILTQEDLAASPIAKIVDRLATPQDGSTEATTRDAAFSAMPCERRPSVEWTSHWL